MAGFYGRCPHHFDDWPCVDVDEELELYGELVVEGDTPVSTKAVQAMMGAIPRE